MYISELNYAYLSVKYHVMKPGSEKAVVHWLAVGQCSEGGQGGMDEWSWPGVGELAAVCPARPAGPSAFNTISPPSANQQLDA